MGLGDKLQLGDFRLAEYAITSRGPSRRLQQARFLIEADRIDAEARLIKRDTPFCEPFEIPDDNQHVQLIVDAVNKVLARRPDITYHEGPCDSCLLVNQGKVPTIEFGPAGGRLHESDEYVDVKSVRKTAEVYQEILQRLLS